MHNSLVYKNCQIKQLIEKIRAKQKRISISLKQTKRFEKSYKEPFLVYSFHMFVYNLSQILFSKVFLHHKYKETRFLSSEMESTVASQVPEPLKTWD